MKNLVCNFAVIRFMPYKETEEFVNLGIVLACPRTNYLDFMIEKRKHKRVTDFFPELELNVLKSGLADFRAELNRIVRGEHCDQLVLPHETARCQARFQELIRPREALFHFGRAGTALAPNPRLKLKDLFDHYVERQFAQEKEYQEVIMRERLATLLRDHQLEQFYKPKRVGNQDYHVNMPFVYEVSAGNQTKAIKPLHLDKKEPTDIYRHGDHWISAIMRLKRINHLPDELLFTVKMPRSNQKREAAAREISQELERLDVRTVSFADRHEILEFARVPRR